MTTPSAVMVGVQENSSIRSAPSTLIGRPARTERRGRKAPQKNPACTAAANPTTAATRIAAATAIPISHRRGEAFTGARLPAEIPAVYLARATIRFSRLGLPSRCGDVSTLLHPPRDHQCVTE